MLTTKPPLSALSNKYFYSNFFNHYLTLIFASLENDKKFKLKSRSDHTRAFANTLSDLFQSAAKTVGRVSMLKSYDFPIIWKATIHRRLQLIRSIVWSVLKSTQCINNTKVMVNPAFTVPK